MEEEYDRYDILAFSGFNDNDYSKIATKSKHAGIPWVLFLCHGSGNERTGAERIDI